MRMMRFRPWELLKIDAAAGVSPSGMQEGATLWKLKRPYSLAQGNDTACLVEHKQKFRMDTPVR
jgi:hypothetical protein